MDMNLKHLPFGRALPNTTIRELEAGEIQTIRRHMRTTRACNHRVVLRVIPRHSTLAACLHRLLVGRATPRHRSRRIPLDGRMVRRSITRLSLSPHVVQALCMRFRLSSSSISSRIRVMGGSLHVHLITNHHP
jgi:hypothetical protein